MKYNGKSLLDKMSDADPKLIADAEKKPLRKRNLLIGISSGMATAAAAVVITFAAVNAPVQNPPVVDNPSNSSSVSSTSSDASTSSTSGEANSSSDNTSSSAQPEAKDPPVLDFGKYKDLPKIGNTTNYAVSAGCSGGPEFYNYSELAAMNSLWSGEEFETMPVYMSHSTDVDIDVERMYAMVRETAEALGYPADTLEITDTYPPLEFYDYHRKLMEEAGCTEEEIQSELDRMTRQCVGMTEVEAENDSINISIDSAFNMRIRFNEPIEFPNEYNFTTSATDEERAAVLDYLIDKYKALIPFEELVYSTGSFSAYKAGGGLAEQIFNEQINCVDFDAKYDQDGVLYRIRIYSDANCTYLGDYPVLTAAQAEEILKSNRYEADKRMPADAEILQTRLCYTYNDSGATAVMPIYKFYVKSDEEIYFDKEVRVDVYTIPAVPEEFIDMNTTDYGVRA